MREVVVVSGVRSAVGTMGGSLADVHQADLGGMIYAEAVKRAGLSPDDVDEVIVGNVGQVAESGFLGRMVSLKAGFPLKTTAYAVNRQCGSGLEAINSAVLKIQAGYADVIVAGGTENMNQLPYYVRKARFGYRFGHGEFEDGLLTILTWPMGPYPNGVTAENLANRYGISRQEQDEWALLSQQRAAAAIQNEVFKKEILPIEVKKGKDTVSFAVDEHPRIGITMERLAKLKPAFVEGGTVTPGNSSGINDGAGAVVLMGADTAEKYGIKPLLKMKSFAVAGCDPATMGYGPVPATQLALKRAGLSVQDIDLIELNEAFAVQTIVGIRELGLDVEKVNVNGGAIALGHPIGATGGILTVKLLHEMKRRNVQFGLVSMCIGGGQGITTVYENCQ
ncbi:thiolase family protein [Thermoactinomyces sp. CICC 10522]|uniref:thiolase family protein n=1 Tax=Thermoactinomyces sp. CICC 10522 TaxID=2767427 RepID=UPI0018DCC817|nr:thiolase family protein [Thermoactinomyces sp. CICC 10522]MBH8605475.1 thiolase family protein [Thermoactinomyces sp. CICC 10522]